MWPARQETGWLCVCPLTWANGLKTGTLQERSPINTVLRPLMFNIPGTSSGWFRPCRAAWHARLAALRAGRHQEARRLKQEIRAQRRPVLRALRARRSQQLLSTLRGDPHRFWTNYSADSRGSAAVSLAAAHRHLAAQLAGTSRGALEEACASSPAALAAALEAAVPHGGVAQLRLDEAAPLNAPIDSSEGWQRSNTLETAQQLDWTAWVRTPPRARGGRWFLRMASLIERTCRLIA
jgi:hypothetical protein